MESRHRFPIRTLVALAVYCAPLTAGAVYGAQPSGNSESTALMDFQAVGAAPEEASAVTDRMQEELLKLGGITLVDRSQIDAVLKEQAFQQTGCTSNECAVQVGKVLGARRLVSGKVTRLDADHWVLAASLIEVETSETLRSGSVNVTGDIFSVLNQGVPPLAAKVHGGPQAEAAPPPAPRPPGPARGFSIFTGTAYHSGTMHSQAGSLSYASQGGIAIGIDYQWVLAPRYTLGAELVTTTSTSVSGGLGTYYDTVSYTFLGAEGRYWVSDRSFAGIRAGQYGTYFSSSQATQSSLTLYGDGVGLTGGYEWPSGWYVAGALDSVTLAKSSGATSQQINGSADEVGLWVHVGYRWR